MQDMHTTRPEQVTSSTSGQLSFLSFFCHALFLKGKFKLATIHRPSDLQLGHEEDQKLLCS